MSPTELILLGAVGYLYFQSQATDPVPGPAAPAPSPVNILVERAAPTPTPVTFVTGPVSGTPTKTPLVEVMTTKVLEAGLSPNLPPYTTPTPTAIIPARVVIGPVQPSPSSSVPTGQVNPIYLQSSNKAIAANAAAWAASGRPVPISLQ